MANQYKVVSLSKNHVHGENLNIHHAINLWKCRETKIIYQSATFIGETIDSGYWYCPESIAEANAEKQWSLARRKNK
jgi:hypothetical protein